MKGVQEEILGVKEEMSSMKKKMTKMEENTTMMEENTTMMEGMIVQLRDDCAIEGWSMGRRRKTC